MHNESRPGASKKPTLATLLAGTLTAALALLPLPSAGEEAGGTQGNTQEVDRLQSILRAYYADDEPRLPAAPAAPAEPAGAVAVLEAPPLEQATYSTDKVYLSGSEGNTVLAQFTRRLQDPRLPELHRDVAPICTVKTRLFDTLVHSERLSLKPVGKHHYIGSIKLQPGESTFAIKSQQWQVRVPEDSTAREHLITFYRHPGKKPQFHTVAVQDMIAAGTTHVPDWLPPDIADQLNPQ